MQYSLMCEIVDQYSYSGYTDHINLTSFPGQSLQVPGMGNIININ